jgi:transposase
MGFIQGEGRTQGTLFPVVLDDLIPCDHVCRVIDAFVGRLDMLQLAFERAEPAETGRPGYDPRDLLKLYLYGYLQQIRSSRRLEAASAGAGRTGTKSNSASSSQKAIERLRWKPFIAIECTHSNIRWVVRG